MNGIRILKTAVAFMLLLGLPGCGGPAQREWSPREEQVILDFLDLPMAVERESPELWREAVAPEVDIRGRKIGAAPLFQQFLETAAGNRLYLQRSFDPAHIVDIDIQGRQARLRFRDIDGHHVYVFERVGGRWVWTALE